jgi:octaprenyl-diphosphate synthase
VLFAAATRLGGLLGALPSAQENALADYGLNLGFAFQIADDVLDYVADAGTLGKNIGDDLAEGKVTLPLIYALERADPAQAAHIRHAIETGGLDALDAILAAIRGSGAVARARIRAQGYAAAAKAALSTLPQTTARAALEALADYALQRDH